MQILLEDILGRTAPGSNTDLTITERLTQAFAREWPDQVPVLRAYHSNRNCSCKNGLFKTLSSDADRLRNFLNTYYDLLGGVPVRLGSEDEPGSDTDMVIRAFLRRTPTVEEPVIGVAYEKAPEPPPPQPLTEVEKQNLGVAAKAHARQLPPFSLIGKTFDIADTPVAFTELLSQLQQKRGRYQGLTVRSLPESTMVRVYFY